MTTRRTVFEIKGVAKGIACCTAHGEAPRLRLIAPVDLTPEEAGKLASNVATWAIQHGVDIEAVFEEAHEEGVVA